MPKLVPIVEGDGEKTAVPLLLRKILYSEINRYDIQVSQAKNANGRGNLTKEGGLERFIKYAWKEPDCGAIVVLLDAENECPEYIAKDFFFRIEAMGVLFPVVIVVAKRMYETWFIASISSIAGHSDLPLALTPPDDAEEVRNAKRWIEQHFPAGRAYKETQDQEELTNLLDVTLARSSRSFRRLLHAIDEAVDAIDTGKKIVTPHFDKPA